MKRSEYLSLFEEGLRKRGFVTEASRSEIVKELEAHIVDLTARYPDRGEDSLLAELPTPDEMASFMADEMPGPSQGASGNDQGTEIPIGRGEAGPRDREPPRGPWGRWNDWSDAEYSREGEPHQGDTDESGPGHRHGGSGHQGQSWQGRQGHPGNNWNDWEQWRNDWRQWKGNWREWRRQWKDQWKHQWKDQWKNEWKHNWEHAWGDAKERARRAKEDFERRGPHRGYAPWEPGFGEMMNAIFSDVFGPGGSTRNRELEGSIDIGSIQEIEIHVSSADLKLSRSEGSNIEWRAKLRMSGQSDSWQPEVRIEGDRAYIDLSGGANARTEKVSLAIPEQVAVLRVSANSGDIKAEDLDQGLEIRIASGDIRLGRCGSFVRIFSASGEVKVDQTLGSVQIESESGDIELGRAEGETRIRTSSGDIEVKHAQSLIVLESVSGEIRVDDSCCNLGGSVQTVSGDIDLRVGNEMNAEFSIRSNGDIDIDTQAGIVYDDPDDSKRLQVGVGSGGKTITIESTSGDIKIRA